MERDSRHATQPADELLRRAMARMEPLDERRVSILRAMTTVERVAITIALNRSERARLKSELREKFPSWSENQISREVGAVWLSGTSTPVHWPSVPPSESRPDA